MFLLHSSKIDGPNYSFSYLDRTLIYMMYNQTLIYMMYNMFMYVCNIYDIYDTYKYNLYNIIYIYVYIILCIYIYIYIYKHLIQKEICSTLGNKNYSKNIVLGCNWCSCQCSWCLGYCKPSGSFKEQSPYGFYWQGCENIWGGQFLRLSCG